MSTPEFDPDPEYTEAVRAELLARADERRRREVEAREAKRAERAARERKLTVASFARNRDVPVGDR